MSAKYQRIKKRDLALPAPLRWLTRAFSSITMAVILLSLVIVYGTVASVPIFFLVLGGLYIAITIVLMGAALTGALLVWRKSTRWSYRRRALIAIALIILGVILCFFACVGAYQWAYYTPLLANTQSQTVRKLPYFEMTKMQFYAWWPFHTILFLFICNLIWATVRRIPFRFEYIGVLTVHSGILIMALGAVFYGYFRTEGDTILIRQDLGGSWVSSYYDFQNQALYVTNPAKQQLMMPLWNLPRYNDYPIGNLDINLSQTAHKTKVLPENLHISIPGFLAYARLNKQWKPAKAVPARDKVLNTSPAIVIQSGSRHKADGQVHATLLADVPNRRSLNLGPMSIEYLVAPPVQRVDALRSQLTSKYGLVVQVKSAGQNAKSSEFRKVYSIHEGSVIQVGDTGYTLKIGKIGLSPHQFTKEGYRNTLDTRALVGVSGHGKKLTRICFYRYWKLSHDIQLPGQSADALEAKSKTKTTGKTPEITLTFLDASKARFYIIASSKNDQHPLLLARLPGANAGKPISGTLDGNMRFPVGALKGKPVWMHITNVIQHMVQVHKPDIIPRSKRKADKAGNYTYALLPVLLTLNRPQSQGGKWQKLVWLRHMQYPRFADNQHKPVDVDVPTVGKVQLAFSRQRHSLPFEMKMLSFKMTPYPGSQIPKNFASRLQVRNLNSSGHPVGKAKTLSASLNNPIVYYPSDAPLGMGKIKISQIGWDAPVPGASNAFAKNAQGQYLNQQRYTILGIGNNVAIHIIALGAILIFTGIPWAFYIKPWIVRRRSVKMLRGPKKNRRHNDNGAGV